MTAYFRGQPIFGPRGPAGPDGNPVGTVISYMGTTAPKDYLVCDGAQYNIVDYPVLAAHFSAQFGTANHFGGDGTTTFAVPDMRNLFLRGYHGSLDERLSGEIGIKQDPTKHTALVAGRSGNSGFLWGNYTNEMPGDSIRNIENADSTSTKSGPYSWGYISVAGGSDDSMTEYYTSRPVNMAVLYCIKATESYPAENVYSAEETRIGTWVDGKPLYRKTIVSDYPAITTLAIAENVDTLVNMTGLAESSDIIYFIPYFASGTSYFVPKRIGNSIVINCVDFSGYIIRFSVEYTKTTD